MSNSQQYYAHQVARQYGKASLKKCKQGYYIKSGRNRISGFWQTPFQAWLCASLPF